MVYIFRFLLPQEKEFMAEIAVPSSYTFFELHQTVQDFFKYDNGQMASFIITDEQWNKLKEIAMVDFEKEAGESPMKKFKLSDIFSQKGQRMLYVFDFFSERAFFVQLSDIQDNDIRECEMLDLKGKIPDQTKIDLDFPDVVDELEDEDDFNEFDDLQIDEDEF